MEVSQASGDQNQVSDEVLETKKDSVAYDTYKKVLAERKRDQAQLNELTQRLKAFEEKDMQEKGKSSELVESLRSRLTEKESLLNKAHDAFKFRAIRSEFVNVATKLGCKDPIKLMRMAENEEIEGIEVDNAYEVNKDDIGSLIEKLKKENDFLFSRKEVNIVDGVPSNKAPKPKSINELSTDELIARIKNIKD